MYQRAREVMSCSKSSFFENTQPPAGMLRRFFWNKWEIRLCDVLVTWSSYGGISFQVSPDVCTVA